MIMNSRANAIFGKEDKKQDKKQSNIGKQKSAVYLGHISAQHDSGTVF